MIDDKFGVVLILPEYSFSLELNRENILDMMKEIDDKLTAQDIPDEIIPRCAIMMNNALKISHLVATKHMDSTSAVSDIAYSFVYAFGKQLGFDQMVEQLRGLTGSCLMNTLNLNPCLAEEDFQEQVHYLTRKMREHDERGDDVWDYDLSFSPTVH